MDKKLLFNDALSSLIEFAAANANHVSTEDIHTFFNDIIEDEKQYEFIYKYLQESKIKIDGMDYIVSCLLYTSILFLIFCTIHHSSYSF